MSKTCPECGGDRRRLRPEYFNIPAKDMEAPDCFTCKGVGKLKNRRNRMKDKQKSTDEEIRQAFEENLISIRTKLKDILRDNFYDTRFNPTPANVRIEHLIADMIETGYKARDKSAQAEIENIKEWNAKVFKTKDAEIEQFKEKLEEVKEIVVDVKGITQCYSESADFAIMLIASCLQSPE